FDRSGTVARGDNEPTLQRIARTSRNPPAKNATAFRARVGSGCRSIGGSALGMITTTSQRGAPRDLAGRRLSAQPASMRSASNRGQAVIRGPVPSCLPVASLGVSARFRRPARETLVGSAVSTHTGRERIARLLRQEAAYVGQALA